jgi:hypothetical protein
VFTYVSAWPTSVVVVKRRCRPLMAFDPTINLGNGRERHFGGTGHSGVAGPIPKRYAVRKDQSRSEYFSSSGVTRRRDAHFRVGVSAESIRTEHICEMAAIHRLD